MPERETPLRRLGFLTIGLFDADDPGPGLRSTLEVIELGEQLGFDSAWLRHRHFQAGISSPMTMIAAAAQRTSRIEFGTAVTPLGWENPLRMAEDLATVDILSGGRLNPGISVGQPNRWDDVKDALYPDTAQVEDFGYRRVERLLALVGGEAVSPFAGTVGMDEFSRQVQPQSKGLRSRVWYGAASRQSAQWAGAHDLHLLTSNVMKAEESDDVTDFAGIQRAQIDAFRAESPHGRVSQGLVVIPTDSASPEQRARYHAYVESRSARLGVAHGPARVTFAPDLVGTSAEIADALYAHAAFRAVDEVAFALPFSFEHADYVQLLTDIATRLGPALGWTPA